MYMYMYMYTHVYCIGDCVYYLACNINGGMVLPFNNTCHVNGSIVSCHVPFVYPMTSFSVNMGKFIWRGSSPPLVLYKGNPM